jgi:ABC-type glycerol-3-phosphate transport system substrate-binding protein
MRGTGLIVSSPEEQLASWLFLKHMASTQSNIIWTEYTQYQPYTFSALNELSQEFLDANLQFSSIRDVLLGGDVRIWSRPPLASDGQMVDAFEEMLASILTGGEDVAAAAAAAEEEANEVLAESLEDMG